jgi:hypothetical protein
VDYVKGAAKKEARERERERTGCLMEQASYVGTSYEGMRDKLFNIFRFWSCFPRNIERRT